MSGIVLDVTVNDDGTVNLKSLANALNRVGDESDKAGKKGKKSMDTIGESAKKMSSAVTRYAQDIRAQMAMALGSAGMGMLVKQGLQYNATLEATKAQFEVITGSAGEAAKIMKDLVDFAAKTPFELTEVANSAKILRAFGIEGNDSLRIVGDAAAAAQRPLEEVAMVFGRIKSGAFGEAFMRLAEMGIATREMLEAKGLQFDRGGSYKGSAEQAIAAVQAIVQERFGGMMDKMSGMWVGLMSTLRDAWSGLLGKITGPLFDVLKPKIKELSDWLNEMADSGKVKEWGTAIADVAGKAITGVKDSVAWVAEHQDGLGETLKLLRDIGIAMGAIVIATKLWSAAMAVLDFILFANPVGIFVAVAAAIYEVVQRTIGWKKAWEEISWVLRGLILTLNSIVEATRSLFTLDFGGVKSNILGIGDAWRRSGDEVATYSARIRDAYTLPGTPKAPPIPLIFRQPGAPAARPTSTTVAEEVLTAKQRTELYTRAIQQNESALLAAAGGAAMWAGAGQAAAAMLSSAAEEQKRKTEGLAETQKRIAEEQMQVAEQQRQVLLGWASPALTFQETWMTAFGRVEDSFYGMADRMLIEGQNWTANYKQTWESLYKGLGKLALDYAVLWIGSKVRMSVAESVLRKKALADYAATAVANNVAAQTEQGYAAGAAAAKYHMAYAAIPFVGPGIASAMIAAMQAQIIGTKAAALAFAGGGVVPGYGTRDSIPAMLTPRERVLTVQQNYQFEALGGLDGLRAALANRGGGAIEAHFHVGGGVTAEDLEEELVPVLERLADRRRLSFVRSR